MRGSEPGPTLRGRAWSRTKQVLAIALERTPDERGAFLDQACGADTALRGEVESLLAAHAAAGAFAERAPAHALKPPAQETAAEKSAPGEWLLQAGDRLGPYLIEARLGSGGMGQVYRATDTRLQRTVAIKILPPEMRKDGHLRQRFEREARAIAALRHPHICVLHDVGREGEIDFIVMEYLDGESLAERLAAGPLPLHQVIRYAIEIAEALAEMHQQGIIHRDLKPANIMVTASGARLLDFGTAKQQLTIVRGMEDETRELLTGPATIIGTLHYMAPEQLEGKEVDGRADLFAFGAVLYEMASGKRAFDGASPASVVAAILECEPAPIAKTGVILPRAFEQLIVRCLRKDPSDRWQRAEEVACELRRASSEITSPQSGRMPRRLRPALIVAFAILGVAAWRTGLGTRLLGTRARSIGATSRASDGLPSISIGNLRQVTHGEELEITPAISPDAQFVAYVAGNVGQMRVFIRSLTGNRSIRLSDNNRALELQPRWSPGDNQILYVTDEGAFIVSAFGGTPRRVNVPSDTEGVYSGTDNKATTRSGVTGAAWSPEGGRVAIASGGALSIVPLGSVGAARVLARWSDELHQCDWSRDGKWIACTSGNAFWGPSFVNNAPSAIVLIPATGGQPIEVTDRAAQNQSPVWGPDGRRLYFVSTQQGAGDIYSVEISPTGQAKGAAVRETTGLGATSIAFSVDGKHLTYSAYTARANLWSLPIPTRGPVGISRAHPLTQGNQVIEAMRVSRDEKWLLYDSTLYGSADIFRMPVGGGAIERLTTDPGDEFAPDLSPDGLWLAYHSWRTKSRDIFVQPVEGGPPEQVTSTPWQESYPEWSPDGRSLIFVDQAVEHGVVRGMFIARRDGSGRWQAPEPLNLRRAQWLPDGRSFIAWGEGERLEVARPDVPEFRLLYNPRSHTGDPVPDRTRLGPDGKTLYFKSHDADGRASIWSIPVSGSRPTLLVKFDDLSRPSSRGDFAVGAGQFFFAIDDRRSNIWIADVTAR